MDKETVDWLQKRVRERRLALQQHPETENEQTKDKNASDDDMSVKKSMELSEVPLNDEILFASKFREKIKSARRKRQRKKSAPVDHVVAAIEVHEPSALNTDASRTDAFKEQIRGKIQQARAKATKIQVEKETIEAISDKSEENLSLEREKSASRKRLKNLWQSGIRETIRESQESKERASFESSYDFFARVWDPAPPDRVTENDVVEDESHSIDIEDTEELLSSDYREEEWVLVKQTKADYLPSEKRTSLEKQLYFFPSSSKVPLMVKMGEDHEARNLEEEGLYVGVRPSITQKNVNTIENRLLRQNELNWFDSDCRVKMLPLPTRSNCCRPTNLLGQDSSTNVMFCKAENLSNNAGRLSKEETSQLDVDVAVLVFTHHPLFSREHVLASRLQSLHRQCSRLQEDDAVMALTKRIRAAKSSIVSLQESRSSSLDAEATRLSREKRLDHYFQDIRKLRHARDKMESELRLLLKNILATWSEIKALRDDVGYSCTSIKLLIHKEEADVEADEKEWKRDIQEELEELAEVHDSEYAQLVEKYEARLHEWKEWHAIWKQAKKRKKKREQSEGSSSLAKELEDTFEEDAAILSKDPLSKPDAPPKFDADSALQSIREKALRIRRKPGEPKLSFEIGHSESVTPNDQCPVSEQQRRADVSQRKIFVKIYFNGKEVCQTSSRKLSQDFSVVWAEIFRLWIKHYPKSLSLKIFESSGLKTTEISETFLPIPNVNQTSGSALLEEEEFTSDMVVTCRHSGVGSGLQQTFGGGDSKLQWLLTGGILKCRTSWGVGEDGQSLAPKIDSHSEGPAKLGHHALHKMNHFGLSNVEQLKKWLKECHLDPNDPENAHFFDTIEHLELLHGSDGLLKGQGVFRLDPLQDEFDFVTEAEMANNSRFQLLRLRSKESGDFRHYQMVPAYEKEIPADVVERLWRKDTDEANSMSQPREIGHVLNKMREEVLKHFLLAHHERTLEDMVMEEKVPSIGTIGFNLLHVMRKRRPLRPQRKERKRMTGQGMGSTEIKLVVMVFRAGNIPVRVDVDTARTPRRSFSTVGEMSFEPQVRPFVEVTFQRVTKKTSVAEGPHPTWNEELHLPFQAPNDDYVASNLEKIRDLIYFNLFDEVLVDLLEDERDRETVIHQKMERRWLGTFQIPFSTLYLNSKIEGTFRLNVPPVLLGYKQESSWTPVAAELQSVHTYLSFYLTLEPSLQLPELFREKRTTDPFLRHAEEWQQELSKKFPQRPFKTIALDVTASWVFIPRFLSPLKPPEELVDTDSTRTEEKLARFVSLIPATPDKMLYPGVCDVWTTCDQFLQVLSGDEEEHAILLCNFFLSLGKKAFLLLGVGIPEGATAYVLTMQRGNADVRIWNPTTGDSYHVSESHLPLRTVGCLISPDNIWANIQKHDQPSHLSFNISDTKHWQPYFSRKHFNPGFTTIQPEELVYSPVNRKQTDELQEKIEVTLRESLMKWRKRFRTSWNRYCIQILRKLLPRFEENSKGDAEIIRDLEPILASHKMCGFPLHMPFTNIDTILDSVFATGVHLAEDKDLEFALAVYLHPYPSSVISVWVYIATLIRRR